MVNLTSLQDRSLGRCLAWTEVETGNVSVDRMWAQCITVKKGWMALVQDCYTWLDVQCRVNAPLGLATVCGDDSSACNGNQACEDCANGLGYESHLKLICYVEAGATLIEFPCRFSASNCSL